MQITTIIPQGTPTLSEIKNMLGSCKSKNIEGGYVAKVTRNGFNAEQSVEYQYITNELKVYHYPNRKSVVYDYTNNVKFDNRK